MSTNQQACTDQYSTFKIVCKNCDTKFVGQYCPHCGQHVKEIERPLRFMIVDFMGTMVSFDTRLIKTLVAILFKPGKLTQDFLDGKRARYMPPFRFYVFISFVMFLLVSNLTTGSIKENYNPNSIDKLSKNQIVSIVDSIKHSNDSIYQQIRTELECDLDTNISIALANNLLNENQGLDEDDQWFHGIYGLDTNIDKKDINKYEATSKLIQEHPELYTNKLFQFSSWALFLFMPIFAFFMWLSFRRTKEHYIGHLIFSINIHSFIFFIIVIITSVSLIFTKYDTGWLGYLLLLIPIYQVIGARKLYKRTWIKSFFKMTFVWFMYGFVLFVGLVVLAVFSFLGM